MQDKMLTADECDELAEALRQDDKTLTADECDELAEALRQDAVALPSCSRKEDLLQLALGYRDLANMKRTVLHKVN
jgi:NTP pyrophosphatase (non-canonical NTP hydrolase)